MKGKKGTAIYIHARTCAMLQRAALLECPVRKRERERRPAFLDSLYTSRRGYRDRSRRRFFLRSSLPRFIFFPRSFRCASQKLADLFLPLILRRARGAMKEARRPARHKGLLGLFSLDRFLYIVYIYVWVYVFLFSSLGPFIGGARRREKSLIFALVKLGTRVTLEACIIVVCVWVSLMPNRLVLYVGICERYVYLYTVYEI